jgi:hypothetical protein
VKTQKLVYFIQEIGTDRIIEDNINPLEAQAALDRAVSSQKLAGLYRDKPTFMMSSKVVNVEVESE